ncbi:serine/threonine protein kinase [Aggregatilinea lenta]|uniref:serine/threonine protein kinase n=1 Tax=Aggregatilinea lenta TaxID=913108 RepID=UPI000E5C4485|nr:serine/threonine-protein kinase [Aggregatilinea lenta]
MASDDLIGARLGQYEIKSVLGRGGMAMVYLARQTSMDRDVAIKVMARELADDEQFVQRFEHEAQVIARLQHPHILPVIDFGREGKSIYIVMRLVRGGSLDDRLRGGPLPLKTASRMLTQIASALTFAHEQGVIHRDLKPNNVLLDERDNAYLTDFGIAKMLAGTSKLTATGNVLGTPAYMAPEQWRGEAVDARTDIYSLGVVLYEMLCGCLPFSGETPFTLMYKHFNDPPPLPTSIKPDLPKPIEAVIMRALAKHADERYQSADEMAEDFNRAVNGLPTAAQNVPAQDALDATLIGEGDFATQGGAMRPGGDQPTLAPQPGGPPPVTPPPMAAATASPATPAPSTVAAAQKRGLSPVLIAVAAIILIGLIGGGGYLIFGGGEDEPDPTPLVVLPTETPTDTPAPTDTNTPQPTDTHTPQPTATDTPEPTATSTPAPTSTPRTTTATVVTERVTVRRGPGFDFESIGTLARDEEALVNGVSSDGGWYQIVYGAQLGWISAESVRISGNTNILEIDWPTATPEPSNTPLPTDTDTPEPTATHTPEPTQTESGATPTLDPALTDPALFVPASFEPITLDNIDISLDYPTAWAEPTFVGREHSLYAVPVADPLYDLYPSIVIARGTPDQLVTDGMTDDATDPATAVEHPYGIDFGPVHEVVNDFAYPAYKIDVREADLHAWVWLIEVAGDDWLYVVALAPTGDYDKAFADQVLNPMLESLTIDDQPLVAGTSTTATPESGQVLTDMPLVLGSPVLDRFDDNQNQWRFGTIADGHLTLEIPELDFLGWTFSDVLTDVGPAFYMQATIHLVVEPNRYEYGLVFRTVTDADFYFYSIDHNGRYSFFKAVDGEWVELIPYTTNTLTQTGPNAENVLGALVLGDYIELYLNGEVIGAVVDDSHLTGDMRLSAYSYSDADGMPTVTFDDFVYLPLNIPTDSTFTEQATAVIGTVLPGQAELLTLPEYTSQQLDTFNEGDQVVIFARSQDSQFLFGYGKDTIGWLASNRVSLTRAGEDVALNTLPMLDGNIQGIRVQAWPIVWTAADDDVGLSYGQTVDAALEEGGTASWTFNGTEGDIVTVAAEAASGLDTYLTLTAPDGTVLVEDDDDGPGLNALIEGEALPATGVYTVELRSVSGAGTVNVTLSNASVGQ